MRCRSRAVSEAYKTLVLLVRVDGAGALVLLKVWRAAQAVRGTA